MIGQDTEMTDISSGIRSSSGMQDTCKSPLDNQKNPPAAPNRASKLLDPSSLRYSSFDTGPFIVVIESIDKNVGNLHPMALGLILINMKICGIRQIDRRGANKVGVSFMNAKEANNLLENEEVKRKGFKCYIPMAMLTCRGIIRGVYSALTEQQVLQHMESPQKVLDIRRLNRRKVVKQMSDERKFVDVVEYEPTSSVVVTFAGKLIPKKVYICHHPVNVHVFVPPVILCRKCCRFGHSTSQCRGKERCGKCLEEHNTYSCFAPAYKCIFCRQCHELFSRSCPEFVRQKKVKEAMVFENISFFEANKKYKRPFIYERGDFPPLREPPNPFPVSETITVNEEDSTQESKLNTTTPKRPMQNLRAHHYIDVRRKNAPTRQDTTKQRIENACPNLLALRKTNQDGRVMLQANHLQKGIKTIFQVLVHPLKNTSIVNPLITASNLIAGMIAVTICNCQ